MSYRYNHFIKQNIAPPGTKRIVVYSEDGRKITSIPLGGLTPPKGQPLYSFGLVSDIHLYPVVASWVDWNPNRKFDSALSYFESAGCAFCIVCGDLTQTGFYSEDTSGNKYLDEAQMVLYKSICDDHTLPVYEIAGNHENYYGKSVTDNMSKWESYTGKDALYYTVSQGDDLFVFLGQPEGDTPMSDEAFTFLTKTLAANADKRCFVFVHPVWKDDSGDAAGVYANHSGLGGTLLSSWSKGEDLKNLLKQYPKAVLFHGHTHIKFEEQAKDKNLNYTHRNGFHSVHIPSLGRPRDVIQKKNGSGYEMVYAPSESQGYIVDVYEDFVVLNGMDLIKNIPVPLGVYKINT